MSPLRSLVATLLLVIAATCTLSSQTSEWRWELVHPAIQPYDLTQIEFVDSLYGWVAGMYGAFLSTTDGGRTWRQGGFPANAHANDLFFLDRRRGWIAYDNAILYTDDGGATWSSPRSRGAQSMFFVDPQRGWNVDEGYDYLFHTTDGGMTWTTVDTLRADLMSFAFIHDSLFLSSSESRTFRSTDGAKTWSMVYTYGIEAFSFYDAVNGWGVRWDDSLVSTSDGGATWWTRPEPGKFSGIEAINFVDSLHGALVSNIRFGYTEDGGATWRFQQIDPTAGNSVFGLNSRYLFEIGTGGKLRRSPIATLDWETLRTAKPVKFVDVHFFTPTEGIVAGTVPDSQTDEAAPLWRTEDGGREWTESHPFAKNPDSLYMDVVGEIVWLAAEQTILRSDDRGRNWNVVLTGVADRFRGVDFIDATNGWAITDSTLMRTTDGGDRWDVVPPRSSTGEWHLGGFIDLYALSTEKMWLFLGPHRPSLHTSDGGVSWESDTLHQPFVKMAFVDSLVGFAFSDSGRHYTNDGGDFWLRDRIKPLRNPMLVFFDRQNGLALESNRLLVTENGGLSWESIDTILYGSWRDFICPSDNECWIVGEKSRIIRLQRLASTVPTAIHVSGDALPVVVPNPAHSSFSVDNPDVSGGPVMLLVVDNLGRTVIGPIAFAASDERLHLRCADLAQGTYRLIVRTGDQAVNIPLVIQR